MAGLSALSGLAGLGGIASPPSIDFKADTTNVTADTAVFSADKE